LDDTGDDCLVSVDCTDFEIEEPMVFWKGWYSHKFHGPGLRYEIAVSLKRGDIVWVSGPHACGMWPDLKIFRSSLKTFLDPYERVEADNGYLGEDPVTCKTPGGLTSKSDKKAAKFRDRIRARHETVNARIKTFGVLKNRFRHQTENHGAFFRAVIVLTQLMIENGEPLFGL